MDWAIAASMIWSWFGITGSRGCGHSPDIYRFKLRDIMKDGITNDINLLLVPAHRIELWTY
jgi:hypothetical protein